jgi:hypothetical protein
MCFQFSLYAGHPVLVFILNVPDGYCQLALPVLPILGCRIAVSQRGQLLEFLKIEEKCLAIYCNAVRARFMVILTVCMPHYIKLKQRYKVCGTAWAFPPIRMGCVANIVVGGNIICIGYVCILDDIP